MQFKNNTFLVYGLGKSGVSAGKLLLDLKARVLLYDKDADAYKKQSVTTLIEGGAEIFDQSQAFNTVILSPGVRIDDEFLVKTKRNGIKIISELELGYMLTKAPIIAVTGTNGKTTVTSMITHALKNLGETCFSLGNIGTPLTEKCLDLKPTDYATVEVSSFQLESVKTFCPHIALITNVTQDHLDRHYSMENYVYLKGQILKNLTQTEFAVLNYDDSTVRAFASNVKAPVVWFSYSKWAQNDQNTYFNGAHFDGQYLCYKGERVIAERELNIYGKHNVENALSVISVLSILGFDAQSISQALTTFRGVNHRLEKVFYDGQISYYNDSKATNVGASLTAVDCMEDKTVIILGGETKSQDFAPLFDKLKNSNVVYAVMMGKGKTHLAKVAIEKEFFNFSLANGMAEAVRLAKGYLAGGGNVLLSPACSSLDYYPNYQARGQDFINVINAIYES